MWNESEIDMEELETRLYGQVHHPTTEDFANLSFNLPYSNTEECSKKSFTRYFSQNKSGEPMCNFKTGYQESTYFKTPVNYQTVPNFYNPMGYVPEIALNNIVVLPPPSTHIYTQAQLPIQDLVKERQRQRKREKRKAKRHLAKKLLRENGYNQNQKTFKHHYLTPSKSKDLLNISENECQIIQSEEDIICISESDGSDCEIADEKRPIIDISSDDEDTKMKLSPSDVKCETTQQSHLEIKPLVGYLEKETDTNSVNNADDDVVLVESKPDEVIVISGDDTQSVCGEKNLGNDSSASNSLDNNMVAPSILINKESSCRPGTPESTNDFLENSFSESNDANLNTSISQHLNIEKSGFDVCETESSSSASDIENPCRNSTFIEQEFDVPPQDALSELNLDSFTDYIASGNKNSKGSSTPKSSKTLKSNAGSITKENKNENVTVRNSSDSSSESDYEDDKVTLIEDRPKAKRKLNLRHGTSSETSEDDCCVIKNSFKKNIGSSSSTPLPNLSPITSDEETSNCKKQKKGSENSKSKKIKKKKSSPQRTSSSGVKRKYPKEIEEFIKSKRSKENEDLMKAQSSDSSDNLSEVEVTHSADDGSCNASSVKLLNVDTIPERLSGGQSSKECRQNPIRFKDYWTEDMNKFYFESWGHEDFSVEEARKNMSDSPDKWKILPIDQSYIRMTPRGARCRRCNEFGHRAISCNTKPIICNICGAVGHIHTRCPKSICTSCGQKNYCLTNYCNRCTDMRRLKCILCLQYGHSDSHCPDLWRRYHLSTKPGPLKQPQDSNLKPAKDRWCSGCASNGHFEHECHYYNRTHAATNPTVCSYDDVYDRSNSSTREEMPTQSSNLNASHSSGRNNPYPNISPWIVNNVRNPYMQNQTFIQQFPVFQTIPSLLTLQQGSNVMFTNQFVPQNNIFHQNQKWSSPQKIFSPNKNHQVENDRPQKHYLNFNHSKGQGLVQPQGIQFLKQLGDASNVKIDVVRHKKNNKWDYLCTLEGSHQQIVNVSKKIQNYTDAYIPAPPTLMQMFQGKDFSLKVLRESLAYIANPNVDWISTTKALFRSIEAIQRKLKKSKVDTENYLLQNKLKMRYITLNAVINGKLYVKASGKHMGILKRYGESKTLNDDQLKTLEESYNYVFNNPNKLNIVNKEFISNLPTSTEMERLVEEGVALCTKNNLPELARSLKLSYRVMVHRNYLNRNVSRFKKAYEIIKCKDQQMNATKKINPNQEADSFLKH